MSIGQWRQFYWKLTVFGRQTDEYVIAAESALKFKFPKSYREFIQTIGPGELAEEFRFYAPHHTIKTRNLVKQNRALKKVFKAEAEAWEDYEQISRMVFFADNLRGDHFGWDPLQVTNKRTGECKIFVVPRFPDPLEDYGIETFSDFVHELCLGDTYFEYNQVEQSEREDRNVFERF